MSFHIKFRFNLIIIILAAFLMQAHTSALAAPEPVAQQPYQLGIFPFLPVANLEGIFAPIAAEISNNLKKPVKLRLTSTYDAFISTLKEETFDIVHIHPFDYVRFGQKLGYIPLVARSEDLFAQFSVKAGSPISKLSDLKGKRVGTPPATGAVTYLALDALYKAGLKPPKDLTVRHFPNHLACLQQMQIGNIDACATSASTCKIFEAQFGLKFKRIGNSITIPHTMFAVHKRVPAADRAIISKTLMSTTLSTVNPRLRELFIESGNVNTGNYFKPISDKDYEPARRILKNLDIKN